MKVKKLLLILGIASIALCGCGGKADKDTKADVKISQDALVDASEINADDDEHVSIDETEAGEQVGEQAEETSVDYKDINIDGDIKKFDSVVLLNDAAYEYYSYKEDPAQKYADVVTEFADKNAGKVDVYDLVVPLGSGIIFPDNKKDESPTSDQKEAVDNIFALMGNSVKQVNVVNNLLNHRTEYVYFRTDHHWTQRGAYYAYEEFCKVKGIEAEPLDGFEKKEFEGFLGSFYKDTNEAASLKNNEDTVEAFYPKAQNTSIHVTPSKGDEYDWKVINDVSNYKAGIKYSAFVAGDNPISVIKNNDLTDGSSCIVIKESYGNAFTPFLVDHYQTIYLVDYRYWEGKISDLINETGAKEVIILNNLTMIRNKFQIGQLQGVLQ